MAETRATVTQMNSATVHQTAFFRLLRAEDKAEELRQAISALGSGATDPRVHFVNQSTFSILPGAPFAYWVSDSVRQLFGKLPAFEGTAGEARQGLATADDFRFVRARWEVPEDRIARTRGETLSPPRGQGKRWVAFAKGGEYSPYWSDIHLVVNWWNDGEELRDFDRAVIRNEGYYFRPGLTWPRRTSLFSPRSLPASCIFGDKGPAVFCRADGERDLLRTLAVFCSRVFDLLVSMRQGREELARSFEVGIVQTVPWPAISAQSGDRLANLAKRCHDLTRSLRAVDETAQVFVAPALLRQTADLQTALLEHLANYEATRVEIVEASAEADRLVLDLYEIAPEDRARLDDELGPHPGSFSKDPSALTGEAFRQAYLGKEDVEAEEEEEEAEGDGGKKPRKRQLTYPSLNSLATWLRVHPAILAERRKALGLFRLEELVESVQDLLMYAVGCAFGRWDVRTALDPSGAPSIPSAFDPLPLTAPGRLVGPNGLPARQSELPADYPIPVAWDGILTDDEGCRRKDGTAGDLVAMVRQVLALLFPGRADPIEAEAVRLLGVRDLRAYFRTKFFGFHLGRYSKSRRKAPIYWFLQSDRKSYGLWVYAPRLTADSLFVALRGYVEPKIFHEEVRLKELRTNRQADGLSRRDQTKLDKEIERQEELLNELARFKAALTKVTSLGYAPEPDDGMVSSAAPLHEILPLWPDAKKMWGELLAGKYEWSAMAAQLRAKGLV